MRRRLALIVAAVTAILSIAFLVPLSVLVREVVADRATSAAEQEATSLAGVAAAVSSRDATAAVLDQLNAGSSRRAALVLPEGTLLGSQLHLPAARIATARTGRSFGFDSDGSHVVLVPVRTADGSVSVAAVAVPLTDLRRNVVPAWIALGGLGLVLVLLGVVLADWLARSSLRPIRDLEEVAHRLRAGDLGARAMPNGPVEVAQVASAVNQLADQIRTLLANEREAAADLSHRLRTPLTALELQAEAVRDADDRRLVTEAVERVTEEVTAVIRAARERPAETVARTGPADLATVADGRMTFWQVLARQEQRAATFTRPDHAVPVAVRAEELVAAVDALVANVFHHTPRGTAFRISVLDTPPRFIVEDDGPGFHEDALQRGTSSAGSTGLGLDIVRRTAEVAGGTIRISAPATGGTRVEVELGTRN